MTLHNFPSFSFLHFCMSSLDLKTQVWLITSSLREEFEKYLKRRARFPLLDLKFDCNRTISFGSDILKLFLGSISVIKFIFLGGLTCSRYRLDYFYVITTFKRLINCVWIIEDPKIFLKYQMSKKFVFV